MTLRLALVAAVLAALVCPAAAGPAYSPPAVRAAETLEPPADLRADAIALLRAVRAGDLDAVGSYIAPKVTTVSGAIDMTYARNVQVIDSAPGGRSAVAGLGPHTGGDWDLPPDVDVGEFLADMELDYIEGALTDGQPWGLDPLLPGTICTYGYRDFDPAEVKRAATALGVDGASFVLVDEGTRALDRPGGRELATLSADRLYAMDYDTETPTDWLALHLPEGDIGVVKVGDDGLQKPYAAGICFKKSGGTWKIVGQASTGL
jgi:hypothetical protein